MRARTILVASTAAAIGCRVLLTGVLFGALSAHASEDLLIENVTLLSPEQAQSLGNRHVSIRDGRIVAISSTTIKASPGVQRLDGSGKFLAPGLMDSHVHVSFAPGLPYPVEVDGEPLAALRTEFARQQPRSYLYFGVTQLLDPSNSPSGIDAFEAQPQRPDLIRCGAAPVLDGYPTVFVDKRVRYRVLPDYIFEPANADKHPLPVGEDPAAHTPEAVVERIATSGARCVKVFIEDGFGNRSDWPLMRSETLRRVRTAALERGLLVVAHANALDMQRIAIDSRVDVIAHGLWNWNELDGAAGLPDLITAHLRAVHERKIGYQPTLRVLPGMADLFRADTLNDPMFGKVVPAALLAWYRTEAGQWFKRELLSEIGDAPDERVAAGQQRVAEQGMRAMRYLYELGHPLLLASDTPSAPTYANQPGYDTYREMQLMAQAGIPLSAIFAAGTINNARQFGLAKHYGTIEVGKIANLLLLDANPHATVEAWNRIEKVILHGAVIERETLAVDQDPRMTPVK